MHNPSSGSGAPSSGNIVRESVFNQWGGKRAVFFTYIHFSHDLTTGLLPALLPFIRQDFKLDYLQSGFIVSAFALSAGLSQFLGGWLSDKLNYRRAMMLGLGGVGLSGIATGLTHSYFAIIATLIMMGVVAGFYHPSGVSALTNQFDSKHRGRVVAMHMVGGSLGFGVGPLLAALIANTLGWHFAYAIISLPAIVASLMVFIQIKTPARMVRQKLTAAAGDKPVTVWQVFKPAIGIIAISVGMQLVNGPIMSFVSLFLVDVHHLTAGAASLWMTIIRMGGLIGSLVGGWLSDKWGRRRTIYLTLVIFGPLVYAIARLPFGPALAIIFILFGWLMTMRETVMQAYVMDICPPHLRATVFGIYFGFGQQGSSIIQPVAGNFMDNIGIDRVYEYISFISLGMSALVVFLAWRYYRHNRGRTGAEVESG